MQSFRSTRLLFCVGLLSLSVPSVALGQSGSITQDEHDKQIKADTERNTKYHNNADDYPVNKPNTPAPAAAPRQTGPRQPTEQEMEYEARMAHAEANSVANFRSWMADAAKGDAYAKYEVALDYFVGSGTRVDKEQAFQWFSAAAATIPDAEFNMGTMLINGDGRTPEVERGYSMVTHAAERGDTDAKEYMVKHPYRRSNVGEFPSMLAYGDEVFSQAAKNLFPMPPKYMKQILDKPKKAYASDYEHLGDMYLWGVGVPQDAAHARQFYELASKAQGSSDSLPIKRAWLAWHDRAANPAAAYAEMMNEVGENHTGQGLYLAALAACGLKQPIAQRKYLEESQSPSTFPPWQALVDLTTMQMQGDGGVAEDGNAEFHLRVAAGGPNRNAEYILAKLYAGGLHGVEKNPAKAQEMLQAAARDGHPDAVRELAQTGASSLPASTPHP